MKSAKKENWGRGFSKKTPSPILLLDKIYLDICRQLVYNLLRWAVRMNNEFID